MMVGVQFHAPNGIFNGGHGQAESSLQELGTGLQEEFFPQYNAISAATTIETSWASNNIPENTETATTSATTTTTSTTTPA